MKQLSENEAYENFYQFIGSTKQQSDGKKRHHSNQSEKIHGGGKRH